MQLNLDSNDLSSRVASPFVELGAYEYLWSQPRVSFKSLADKFAKNKFALPSDFVPLRNAQETANAVDQALKERGVSRYGIRVHGLGEYPNRLRDADYPIEMLYYQGWWDLINSRKLISIVGTRKPSPEGVKRAEQLVKRLIEDDFTIVSGLAEGVDTVAHTTAIKLGGRTIAILGTPLGYYYPTKNKSLQDEIIENHLLISQVPVKRYLTSKNPTANRHFFPARNVTMSALTDATVIIEAGETSGTLTQAKAALNQGRKLFILDSCFHNADISWPEKFEQLGAIRVREYEDISREFIS